MSREIIGTPLFYSRLQKFLDDYAEIGAVRFVEKMRVGYQKMLKDICDHEHIGPARRRTVQAKTITVRQYLIHAGARDFLVLYWIPPEEDQPIVLLNIRIGGQNRFRWT
jgi:hypothetical protein